MNILPQPIGHRILYFRELRGLTQDELAARMQTRGHRTIWRQRIADMEAGKRKIGPDELVSLARSLNVSITELLGVPDRLPE